MYDRWVNLQLGAFVEKGEDAIDAYPEYYVLKLDLGPGNDLDLFPGTWKAISYIVSDRERMRPVLPLYDEFMGIVGKRSPFREARNDPDSYAFGDRFGEDEVSSDNPQNEFYQYLTTDSLFGDAVVGLFGIHNRCWHGRGYIGTGGHVACRVFLARNGHLSHRNLISCALMRREDRLE